MTYGYISDLHERKAGTQRLHAPPRATAAARRSARATRATSTNAKALRRGVREVLRRGSPRTGSRRRTRCSSSAPRRTTSSPARTSAGRPQPTPGRLRRRRTVGRAHYADRPDRRAAGEHRGRCSSSTRQQAARSSTSSRRAPPSTSTASRPRTTRRPPARARHRSDDGEQPVQRRRRTRRSSSTRPARSSSGSCTCRRPTRCARRRTRSSRSRDYFFSGTTSADAEREHQLQRSPATTATTARTSTSPGSAIVGPGVAANGVDGPQPAQGNQAERPERRRRPCRRRAGRHVGRGDRHPSDDAAPARPHRRLPVGRARHHAGADHGAAQPLAATAELADGYTQINSSVGQFATDTLIADTKALASGSGANDSAYKSEQARLNGLADDRDAAATKIKNLLAAAAAGETPNHGQIVSSLAHVKELLQRARLES